MPVCATLRDYFAILTEYNQSDDWKKFFMLKGQVLKACNTITPEAARAGLRRFWLLEARKHGFEIERLKNWN